jgi:cell division protein FtsB
MKGFIFCGVVPIDERRRLPYNQLQGVYMKRFLLVLVGFVAGCIFVSFYYQANLNSLSDDNLELQNTRTSLNALVKSLDAEIKNLKGEIEMYKNGPDKLLASIKQSYDAGDITSAKVTIDTFAKYHPQELQKPEVQKLIAQVVQKEKEQENQRAAAERERIRLANLNNTGIWTVSHYVDSFGERTSKAYITTKEYIKGKFSNSATQDSDLNVNFMINGLSEIHFQLYEYAGNNPVKSYGEDKYTVQIQDKDGQRNTLAASNYSDRLQFGKNASSILHRALMKGGVVKFAIVEDGTPTRYRFEANAEYYENAYRQLTGN